MNLLPNNSDNPTSRLEAFSDGVFSIVITLLVFNIQVPRNLPPDKTLWMALFELWPSYFGFLLGFFLVGIMWINHHNLFKIIGRSDHILMVLNVLLLLTISLVPFVTALIAEYIQKSEAQTATVVFNGLSVFVAIAFNVLWWYASHDRRLIYPHVEQSVLDAITAQYRFGPIFYVVAVALALISVPLSFLWNLGLAIFFALPSNNKLYGGD